MNRTPHPPAPPAGFSLVEICLAVLLASLAALVLMKSSQSNAGARTQSLNRATAVRLGIELADWVRRGGHRDLGVTLPEALVESSLPADWPDCYQPEPGCAAPQAAWHYLLRWRARLHETIADARFVVCADLQPQRRTGEWACDAAGTTLVLKIGTAGRRDGHRPSLIIDLGIAP